MVARYEYHKLLVLGAVSLSSLAYGLYGKIIPDVTGMRVYLQYLYETQNA